MFKLGSFHYIKEIILLCVTLIFAVGCGKKTTFVQQDNISDNYGPIAYSGGWGGANRTISFNLSTDLKNQAMGNKTPQEVETIIQKAMNTWNKAIGRTVLILDTNNAIDYTGNTLPGCAGISDILYFPLCQTVNGIFKDEALPEDWGNPNLSQSQWKSGWVHNTKKDTETLATTVWQAKGNTLTKASMRLNLDNYMFGDTTVDVDYYENNTAKTIVDMQSLLTHELGHVLGLGHVPEETDSIMYNYLNVGPDASNKNAESGVCTTKRELTAKDVQRIKSIYSP